MLSSEKKYYVRISFMQKIEGIHLSLIDGTLETVYSGNAKNLSLKLAGGIYKLIAKFIDYTQEYPLIIDKHRNISLDFNYPSVAPILSFITTHEYFYKNSEYFSKFTTEIELKENPNFLFFAAKYDKDKFQNVVMENLLFNYSVVKSNNEILYQFDSDNSKFNNQFGWLAFSNKLEKGQYFLKWAIESDCRIFPFSIFDNYQTQFFIRYSTSPDFENCFFFYSKKQYFSFEAEEYLVLDKIIFSFKDYFNYKSLTERDKIIIQQHPFLVTLIHILQSELNVKLDFVDFEHLMLPDLKLISENLNQNDIDELLPVISSVLNKFSHITKNKKFSFKPASLIDRTIDHIRHDLFWSNFSKIDNPNDWVEIYSPFVNKSNYFPINKKDNQIVNFGKRLVNSFAKTNKNIIEERLNSLTGKSETENLEKKMNETINSMGNLSDISQKLNLPPTQVLRKYEIYKGFYDKLK